MTCQSVCKELHFVCIKSLISLQGGKAISSHMRNNRKSSTCDVCCQAGDGNVKGIYNSDEEKGVKLESVGSCVPCDFF